MFRLWGRIWKDNHMLKDTVICDDRQETRTHKGDQNAQGFSLSGADLL